MWLNIHKVQKEHTVKSLPLTLSPATPSLPPGGTSALFVCLSFGYCCCLLLNMFQGFLSEQKELLHLFSWFMVFIVIVLRGYTINYLTSLLVDQSVGG